MCIPDPNLPDHIPSMPLSRPSAVPSRTRPSASARVGVGDQSPTPTPTPTPAARHPVILVLDEVLQKVPWESMGLLRGRPVSRCPSVEYVEAALRRRREEGQQQHVGSQVSECRLGLIHHSVRWVVGIVSEVIGWHWPVPSARPVTAP